METRSPNLIRFLPLLALLVASIVIAVLAWRAFGGSVPLEAHGYRATLVLPQVSNLQPQADVRIAGVKIGRVVTVGLDDGRRARVTIEVKARYAPLRTGTRALLRSKTLLGEAYIELTPNRAHAPPLADGGELSAVAAGPTQQRLDDVLQTFAPQTRKRTRQVLAGLSTAFGGRQQDVNNALGRLEPSTADLGDVADQLARQSDDLSTLISSSSVVFGTLGRRQGALRAAINSGDALLATTGDRGRDVAATIRELPPFLHSMRESFARLQAATGDLDRAVVALEPVVPDLQPALRAITTAAPTFRRAFTDLPPVIKAGNRGLPSLTKVIDTAPPAMKQIYPAARELIPVLQLLGTVRNSLTLTLANVGQIHGGYAVGPGNVVTNYVPGVITAWNETVGGWVKRLPTHVGNAYPKPDFLKDIGHYKSYDCRHTGNRLYLPALGSSPKCVTQGPWTFNGKTAYYPRLDPAPP